MGRLLASVRRQAEVEVEVVVVDQSEACSLRSILGESTARIGIVYKQSPVGLSRARNVGLRCVTGDIVGFPDDDCWYSEGLMARVVRFFDSHPWWDGIAGRTVDEHGRSSAGRWSRIAGAVTWRNVWWRTNSATVFLRRRVLEHVGAFDESLGLGAGTPWGSAEELDYMLRVLAAGFKVYYDPSFTVYHPQVATARDVGARARAYSYGAGVGHVIRKHRLPHWFVVYQLVRPMLGAGLCLARGDLVQARYYWVGFRGRMMGWRTAHDG